MNFSKLNVKVFSNYFNIINIERKRRKMRLDERGKACPLPVIETKKALEGCNPGEVIEVIVDNEIAVQNLSKMANHKGLKNESQQLAQGEYLVKITADGIKVAKEEVESKCEECEPMEFEKKSSSIVVLSSREMGAGDEMLGRLLMKGFIYALTEQDSAPDTVLLYNGGAYLSCEGSDSLVDLQTLEKNGAEILTCGTCLNHYGLSEKLVVGGVTNMYEIVEKMSGAKKIIKP